MLEELLFRIIEEPFWVKVPEDESINSSILTVPPDNVNPLELLRVKFLKLLVPFPEILWTEEPENVIVFPVLDDVKSPVFDQFS